MPTWNTTRAGFFALMSAGLWLAAATIYIVDSAADVFSDWNQFDYLLYSVIVLAAGVLGLFATIGIRKRCGGLGAIGMIGLVLIGLGVVASIIAWAFPLWMGLQGVGYLLFGFAMLRRGIAPKWSTLLVSSGFLVGVVTYAVLTLAEVGPTDSYGDYPVAWTTGATVAMGLVSLGLIGWGVWLRNDDRVDFDAAVLPV